jgi:hypothetical protein
MMRFAPLMRLTLRHDYHGAALPPIALHPDAATTALVARPDLRLRRGPGFAELLAAEDREALALVAGEAGLVLTLRLVPQAPALLAATAVLGVARDRIAVLDPGKRPSGPLHAGETVDEGDLRPLPAVDPVTGADRLCRPLAILRLTLDPDATDLAYTVRFGAVARHWTYHVTGGPPDAVFTIRDRTGVVAFEPLGDRRLANGARARSFRSSEPIAESARPAARFALMAEGPFGPRSVIEALPGPRPGPGGLESDGGAPRAVSDIYVNL